MCTTLKYKNCKNASIFCWKTLWCLPMGKYTIWNTCIFKFFMSIVSLVYKYSSTFCETLSIYFSVYLFFSYGSYSDAVWNILFFLIYFTAIFIHFKITNLYFEFWTLFIQLWFFTIFFFSSVLIAQFSKMRFFILLKIIYSLNYLLREH